MLQHLFSATSPRKNGHFSIAQRPGKTKGIQVYCLNRRFTVADMPGYGRPGPTEDAMADYLNTTSWLRAAIYVHDISKEVREEDRETIRMFRTGRRYGGGIPMLLVFTKDDKVDSETHRHNRVMKLRRQLNWPMDWPHAHYTTRRGGYGQVFKNMVGTMLLGLVATEQREDAMHALENELPDIFWDYRDKYVPKPRSFFGRKAAMKKSRSYPDEDVVYTDEELEEEEEIAEKRELRALRAEKKARGETITMKDKVDEMKAPQAMGRDAGRCEVALKRWSAVEDMGRCPICLEELNEAPVQALSCEHALCSECLLRYVESLVNHGRVEPGEGERLLNCPTPGCMKMLVPVALVQERANVNCPECRQSFCAACCQAAHGLESCEAAELQRTGLMMQQNWKRCPSCRHLCERESGCNFMTCPSEQCQGATHFCYLCEEPLLASDHASHYEGFDGAIGLRGPFGAVCRNRPTVDGERAASLPGKPAPPQLSVVRRLSAQARQPYFDAPKSLPKYIRYQATVVPVNVNGAGPSSEPSEVVHFHPRELRSTRYPAVSAVPAKSKRWTTRLRFCHLWAQWGARHVSRAPPWNQAKESEAAPMGPVKVTHGLMQGAVMPPKQPHGERTSASRPSSAGCMV
eukprot:g31865.t1